MSSILKETNKKVKTSEHEYRIVTGRNFLSESLILDTKALDLF